MHCDAAIVPKHVAAKLQSMSQSNVTSVSFILKTHHVIKQILTIQQQSALGQ